VPDRFTLEIIYGYPTDAYKASWYPGMQLSISTMVRFETRDYFEILRALTFVA